jgi:hypothetical protein
LAFILNRSSHETAHLDFAAASAIVAAALPACDYVNLKEIKPGVTTQADVRSRMGEPGFIHWNDDGTATWEYARQPNGSSAT